MLAPLAFAFAAVAVPFLLTHAHPAAAFSLQHAFALICHQRPDRSFWMFGAPLAVCARCLGIYLGTAIGLLLRTLRLVATQLLIAATALNVADWMAEAAGLHGNWIVARFILGLSLGAAGAMLIASSIEESRFASGDGAAD